MESDFAKVEGVIDVVSGFTGGTLKNPTYNGDHTGHYEAVLLTLGLLGMSLDHCQEVCQEGFLAVHYDLSDRLVTYEVMELPGGHPLLDGCTYNAPSSKISFCLAIRDKPRPSNLPPQQSKSTALSESEGGGDGEEALRQ